MIYTKPTSIIPSNDMQRLEKLYEYRILDTHSEEAFDKIALLAAQIFNTTSAFISFVDQDRVFLKSNLSLLPHNVIDRRDSLCSLAILNDNVTVFNDTHTSPDLMESPYVVGEDGIRFYAGAPLKTPEGYLVGTVCVIDNVAREATDAQMDMLKTLSKIIVNKLESRLRYRKSIESQIDLTNIALHEIKNPLASIKLANEILTKDSSKVERMSGMIKACVLRIQNKLADVLKQAEEDEHRLTLSIEEVDLNEMFTKILTSFELLANRKNQALLLEHDPELPKIYADKAKISDVMHNLVSNALKYSYAGTTVRIIARQEDNIIRIEVQDEGQGLSQADISKLFTKFAKLSSKPTGKETSTGLGLSITKSFVELHHGTIEAKSAGKDKGTSFIVSLPLKYEKEELQEYFG
ncbi:GAF domain-containing sensor histidine kinase [Flavobacterium rakeshii]|uniref:GAF domain-containing sensor histidine kinase n=1 Tax=Flavobacterium rakeshii TaxID=1038845 RepID=UPI002E7AD727|nr:GAF domain-containing sensor histidine kinase [Flavobacterium rakeshii]MEE1900098.1 GAF domain-containing sensor histidine kinase [Flavobacterium rakeshii]